MKLEKLLKVVSLEKAALTAASRFTGLPQLEEDISTGHALLLMFCDLLSQQKFDKDHQYAILDVIKNDIISYGDNPVDKFVGVQLLDYKFVALPGWTKVYDYHTLEWQDRLPNPPVVSLCISITALYERWIKPLST